MRAWSRHGTNLPARLGALLAPFADVAPGTTFDGELVAVAERDGQPTQDFAAVIRAVFTGQPAGTDRLRFVAFDLLAVAGQDVRHRSWEERDVRLRSDRRPGLRGDSAQTSGIDYRAGRHRAWLKHKAEFTTRAELCAVRQDRDGRWHAICNIDGRRIHAVAGPRTAGRVGQLVGLVYSRVDADGTLREARVAPAVLQ